jgi:hypothetical protein
VYFTITSESLLPHLHDASLTSATLPVSGDFVAIAAQLHTAPTTLMRFGLVSKPQHAVIVFTTFHKGEIGCHEQISGRLCHRRQDRGQRSSLEFKIFLQLPKAV